MARLLEEWDIPSTAIQVEGVSINTHENAIRSYQALAPRGIRRILLVTSSLHMPRAAGAFRKAGFEVIAAPADFRGGWSEPNVLARWLPSAKNLVDSDMALYEWLGIAIYRLRGWIWKTALPRQIARAGRCLYVRLNVLQILIAETIDFALAVQ